jgi:hypothetical protein
MNHHTTDMADLLQRLERLERQNRMGKRLGLLGLALLAVAGLGGAAVQPAAPESSVAKEFKLLDQNGKTRARLFMTGAGQPAFSLFDEKGKERIYMHINKNGARFVCLEPQGDRLMSSLGTDETGGNISVFNASNQIRFAANANAVFARQKFFVADDKGKERVRLDVGEEGASVTCYDPTGKVLLAQVGAATAQGGFGFATFRDISGGDLFAVTDKGTFPKK